MEKYSIAFDLTGIPQELTAFCPTVRQWTGLPISIGIAETKTLAKIANRLAKIRQNGVLISPSAGATGRWRQLKSDIWGIGRQYAKKLNRYDGPRSRAAARWLGAQGDGRRRAEDGRELRGEDCIGFDDMPQPKQTTTDPSAEVRDYDELANAITMFATDLHSQGQSRRPR